MNYLKLINKYSQTLLFWFFIFFCIFFCSNTHAYVLQGSHIIELMLKNIGKNKSLRVSQRLIIYNSAEIEQPVDIDEVLSYSFPEKFRSDIVSKNFQRYYILSKKLSVTIIGDRIVSETESQLDYYKDILLYNSIELLEERFSELEIDCSISSLGRFQGNIAYIIGAEYPDLTVSQLWVEKKTFRPFRWILIPNKSNIHEEPLEIRYFSWEKAGNAWYPARVEFYQNDILIQKIIVKNIEINPLFSEDIFNIRQIKAVYRLGTMPK